MTDQIVKYIIAADSAQAVAAMKDLELQTKKTTTGLASTGARMSNIGRSLGVVGRAMSTYVSLPLAALGYESIKAATSFQSATDLLRTQAGASAVEVTKIRTALEGLSGKVVQSPEELAKAMYPIASNGLRGAAGLNALTAAAKGAEVGNAGVTETANALAGALKAGLPDIHSASEGMSVLNAIVGKGKTNLAELTASLSTGILESAKQVGLGFRDVGAALDVFTRRGVPANTEATRLRLNLQQMADPKGAALKALAKLGLSQLTLAQDMHKPDGLITALQDLRSHLSGLSKGQETAILGEGFGGARGSANMVALLQALPEMEKIRGELNKKGAAQLNEAFGITQRSNVVKVKEAIDGLKVALIKIGEVLTPIVIPAFTKLAKVAREGLEWFTKLPSPIKTAAVYFGGLLVVVGPLLVAFDSILRAGGSLVTMLAKLGPAAGAAGAEVEGGGLVAGLMGLAEAVGPLLAAGAAAYGLYKAIGAVKSFLTPGGGGRARTPAGRALQHFHQPSEFTANTGGALAMLGGGPSRVNFGALAPGSAAEANYLKEHAGYLGPTTLGGKAAAETAEGRAFREAIARRNEQIVIHNKIDLDGKTVAESTSKHFRDHPTGAAAKWNAESVNRTAKSEASRGSHG